MKHVKDLGGDLFSLEEFAEMVRVGAFTDYDGFGYVVKGFEVDESRHIHPSTFFKTKFDKDTDILWFNR